MSLSLLIKANLEVVWEPNESLYTEKLNRSTQLVEIPGQSLCGGDECESRRGHSFCFQLSHMATLPLVCVSITDVISSVC